jgi:hypothetical protein
MCFYRFYSNESSQRCVDHVWNPGIRLVALGVDWNILLNRNTPWFGASDIFRNPCLCQALPADHREPARSACDSFQQLQTNHRSSLLQVRGLVFDDRVDLYRFKATRDSAIHFVAFLGKSIQHGVFGVLARYGLEDEPGISRKCAFRLARRLGSRSSLSFILALPSPDS